MGESDRKRKTLKQAFLAVCIGIFCAGLSLAASQTRLIKNWEYKLYDLKVSFVQKWRPKPQNVVMFYVDEDSLRHLSAQGISWPWPRELYAGALKFCKEGGAKAVLFDLFFSEDSSYGVGDDESFAKGITEGPPSNFVLFLSGKEKVDDPRIENVLAKSKIPFEGPPPAWMPKEVSLSSLPIEPILEAAHGFGNAQMPPDEDGIYRRIPLAENLDSSIVPSIALKTVADSSNFKKIAWPKISEFDLSGAKVPLDENGRMLINYYGGVGAFPYYSLAAVLTAQAALDAGQTPDIDPSIVKDKIVVIGVAAPGLYDLKPTPVARVYPGPEIHATVMENLITKDFITPMSPAVGNILIFVFSIVTALGLTLISSTAYLGSFMVFIALALTASSFALFTRGVSISLVVPFGAMSMSAFATILKNYLTEGRKKRAIKRAFGQYLSPEIVRRIALDPDNIKLGGATMNVTLFFSDIADFTTISEATAPDELVSQLNDYFLCTTKVIQELGGTLDKYIGDAIMAFWGAPLMAADHAAKGALAALRVQNVLKTSSPFITRIGIHTGPAVVGNIGSDVRFNYTAIGDTVNLASRLEGLNKQFGTHIILSETTYAEAKDSIEARLIGQVRVKGKTKPIGIYEPLGEKGNFGRLKEEGSKQFGAALELFMAARFADAAKKFAEVAINFDDPVSKVYERVSKQHAANPQKDFDGVITFTTK